MTKGRTDADRAREALCSILTLPSQGVTKRQQWHNIVNFVANLRDDYKWLAERNEENG